MSRAGKGLGELAVIESIRRASKGLTPGDVKVGIGDDCAVLRTRANEDLVVTTDFSLEGRHFRRDWHSPESIGHRVLARGLSDLAAMGARPVAAFLSLALPRKGGGSADAIRAVQLGLVRLAMEFGMPLAGGDTSESPSEHLLADIMLVGAVPKGKALLRSGAKAGDVLYCTGSLGGSAAELAAMAKSPKKFVRIKEGGDHPQLFPIPRIKAGRALLKRGLASACMDISDGISTDLAHLCAASRVSAELDAASLPLHPLAAALGLEVGLAMALHGGEDYELLFTAKASVRMPRAVGGVKVTRIGRIVAKRKGVAQVVMVGLDGRKAALAPGGWEHLR